MTADHDAIRARLVAATPGPWRWAGNTDTGEPRLTGRDCDVLAIGWDERSETSLGADAVREFALDSGLDPDEEVERWTHDHYGEPIKEPRLWFYTDHLADPARAKVIYEVAPSATERTDPSVYRADIVGIRHPDADLIANAPTDLAALLDDLADVRAKLADAWDEGYHRGHRDGYNDCGEYLENNPYRPALNTTDATTPTADDERGELVIIVQMPVDAVLVGWTDGDERGWHEEFCWLEAHHQGRLDMLATSVQETGFQKPIDLGPDGRVWDGHHRLWAAQKLGIETIPAMLHGDVSTPTAHDDDAGGGL